MFNIYTEDKESARLYVIETIKAYLSLADKEVDSVAMYYHEPCRITKLPLICFQLVKEFYSKLRIQLSSDLSVHIL